MTLVQQSGDLELMNILQGVPNQNIFSSQNSFNVTVLIPQQISVQQLTNPQELTMVKNKTHPFCVPYSRFSSIFVDIFYVIQFI